MPESLEPAWTRKYGQLEVVVFPTSRMLAARAAVDLAAAIGEAIATRGAASIILATGNSQLEFMAALRQQRDIEWSKVRVFHMDEYRGMSECHPASFRRYIRERLTDVVHPREFFGLQGDADDVEAELRRYAGLLVQYPPDACVVGIGENGHLAFNDPPADFETQELVRVVNLDEACRRQQWGEGWFPSLEEVPRQALSLTVPALLAARRVLVVVPEARKAVAVKAALEGPITPHCPASILQRQPHARLYLDRESSSLLTSP